MLNNSCERPAFLSDDLRSFNHRFIIDKRDYRMRLKDYYIKSKGKNNLRSGCKLENK